MTWGMATQTASDLRALVSRRAGVNARVVVLGNDATLVKALEGNGNTVLVDPDSLEAMAAFGPQVVVAFDGFALRDGGEAFRALAKAAGDALVVFSFANGSSAGSLLSALTGGTPTPSLAEPEVRRWLASAGYVVTSRDVVVTAHRSSGLSADTEAALRQLLEQVNPDAAADRLLLVAKKGVTASSPDRTAGLVSVIVSASDDVAALEGTLSSLGNQLRRPLELVVVATLDGEALDRAVGAVRARSGVTVVAVPNASVDAAARCNAGLKVANGQYVAFAEAADLFSPLFFSSLVKQLEGGTAGWALGTASSPVPPRFSLAEWLKQSRTPRATWLLDLTRLGPFALTFAEGTAGFEALLFARLALLFQPIVVPTATVDVSKPAKVDVVALLTALQGRPLRGLSSLDELLREPSLKGLVAERLESVDPRARTAFEQVGGLVSRVRAAASAARDATEAELKKKR